MRRQRGRGGGAGRNAGGHARMTGRKRGEGCERLGRWVLQGKRYLRGWKIDSNLATLRRSERTPPGVDGGGAQPHHPPVLPHSPRRYAGTSTITAVASFLLPAFYLRPSFSRISPATWPSQYSSIYIEKINIWASSGSFTRAANKRGCAAWVSNPPISKVPLALFPPAFFSRRQRSTSRSFLFSFRRFFAPRERLLVPTVLTSFSEPASVK